ncbi:MAG: hypothetical protein ACE5GL_00890 [Calditrichia bacterium]
MTSFFSNLLIFADNFIMTLSGLFPLVVSGFGEIFFNSKTRVYEFAV